MRLSQHLDEYLEYKGYGRTTERLYRFRLIFFSKEEDRLNLPIYKWSSKQLYDAISGLSANPVIVKSAPSMILSYLDWLESLDVNVLDAKASLANIDISDLLEDTRQYFFSDRQILAKLKVDTKYVSKKNKRQPSDYRMVAAIMLLSWYGLRMSEIVKYKKSGIKHDIQSIVVRGKRVTIHPDASDMLQECVDAEWYTQLNGYTVCHYKYRETLYLLRTAERKSMSVGTAQSIMSSFNSELPAQSVTYKIEKVYWSGVFSRAYQHETSFGFPDLDTPSEKMEFFGNLFSEMYKNTRQVNSRLREYKTYTSVLRKAKKI